MTDKLIQQKNKVVKNTVKYFKQAHTNNAVLGLSGGVDSAVSAEILKESLGGEHVKLYFIDIESLSDDYKLAKETAAHLDIELTYVDLSNAFKAIKNAFTQTDKLALGNIKSRLRAMFLYDAAFKHQALVCGTSNLDELYVGYFTKFGDSANDYPLLCGFIKSDVYALAKHYKLPADLLIKPPSAGLVANQTDEHDLGFSYSELDKYLSHQTINTQTISKINSLHLKNQHKLSYNYNMNKTKRYRDPWIKNNK